MKLTLSPVRTLFRCQAPSPNKSSSPLNSFARFSAQPCRLFPPSGAYSVHGCFRGLRTRRNLGWQCSHNIKPGSNWRGGV